MVSAVAVACSQAALILCSGLLGWEPVPSNVTAVAVSSVPSYLLNRARERTSQHVWFRAAGKLPDDPILHTCVVTYASDLTLLDTSLLPHGKGYGDGTLQMASLDHAMWFHRPFRADDWLLYDQDTPSASGGRGLGRGLIYTKEGRLAVSVVQEGLIRPMAR